MNSLFRHYHRLPALLILALALLVGALPAAPARANEPDPDWLAVSIVADFTLEPWSVVHTVYAGKNGPGFQQATILKWKQTDITASCRTKGKLGDPDAKGYVAFDGATFIECETPGIAPAWAELYPTKPPLERHITCPCQLGAPLFASADAILASGTRANPVIAAQELGMVYSLPRNGNPARSRIWLGSPFNSASWTPQSAGNQLLMGGFNGPAIIAADAQFGWLNYLDPAWRPGFAPVLGLMMRHWYQAPNSLTNVNPVPTSYSLFTGAHRVHIGYNPTTNEYFKGSLRKASIDPGCPSS